MFLKTLATTSFALQVYCVLHVASPRINETKYSIISHVACKYTCIKHNSFRFIALLFMPRLSEHERSGAIDMLKAGVCVSGVARYHNCHPSTLQCLRDRYQATGTVKDKRRTGQPRMATSIKSQLTLIAYRLYLHRQLPFQLATVSARRIVIVKFMPLVKSSYPNNNFLIAQPKHMLWVLKRTVSLRHMLKVMGKKIFATLHSNFLFI